MLDALDIAEKDTVRRALLAAADGPFFPDWEFETLFGVSRDQVRETARAIQTGLSSNEMQFRSVNQSLFMLTSYPIEQTQCLTDYQLDRPELARLLKKIRVSLGKPTDNFIDYME
jgi:hypothetical protein